MRMWINGTEITSFAVDTAPPLNMTLSTAASQPLNIGKLNQAATLPFDGRIFQPALYSGTLIPLSSVWATGGHPVALIRGDLKTANNPSSAVTNDDVLGAAVWTNNNAVTTTTSIPT